MKETGDFYMRSIQCIEARRKSEKQMFKDRLRNVLERARKKIHKVHNFREILRIISPEDALGYPLGMCSKDWNKVLHTLKHVFPKKHQKIWIFHTQVANELNDGREDDRCCPRRRRRLIIEWKDGWMERRGTQQTTLTIRKNIIII